MDLQFKKMKNGNVIVVCSVDEKSGVVHGWNLVSKNLRIKTYKLKSFESRWMKNFSEIALALQEVSFYNLEDCKYHKASVTKKRWDEVALYLADW